MHKKIIGIYLAAGKSTRFKQDKLSVSIRDKYLGSIALKEALHAALDYVVVVMNQNKLPTWLSQDFSPYEARKLVVTVCRCSENGQAYSLQQGLHKARAIDQDAAIMVMLADQPFVTRSQINDMIDLYQQKEDLKCIGLKHTYISPPVIITPYLFTEIFRLTGDEGARKIIEKYRHESYFLSENDPKVFVDIDTQADFHKWEHSFI